MLVVRKQLESSSPLFGRRFFHQFRLLFRWRWHADIDRVGVRSRAGTRRSGGVRATISADLRHQNDDPRTNATDSCVPHTSHQKLDR